MNQPEEVSPKRAVLRIVLPYSLFGTLYILYSDKMLRVFTSNPDLISAIQTLKGLLFVVVTSVMLFFLSRKNINTLISYYAAARQNSDEAQRKEEMYWSLFNQSPIPTWIYDAETLQIVRANIPAIEKYGYTMAEFLSLTVADIRPVEDIPELHEALRRSRENTRRSWKNLFRHKKKDGSIIHVKIESTDTIFNNRPARLVVATDVTTEENARAELRETNRKLQAASEMANLGYWTNDFRTGVIQWSDELYRIFGLEKGSFPLTLDSIRQQFHPNHQKQFDNDIRRVFQDGKMVESEHCIVTPAGKEKWIMERISLLVDENNQPYRLEGIALDITPLKDSQKAIMQSNERYELVMQAAIEAIIDWDIVKEEVYYNVGFREIFGYETTVTDTKFWANYIHPEDKEKVLHMLRQSLADSHNNRYYASYRFLRANGTIAFVQHRGVFIRNEAGRVVRAVGAMVDVTELSESVMRISQQNERLREIAWIQSHVVRAPLATLMGLVDLMRIREKEGIDEQTLIADIEMTARKLDEVIHTIVRKSEMVDSANMNEN